MAASSAPVHVGEAVVASSANPDVGAVNSPCVHVMPICVHFLFVCRILGGHDRFTLVVQHAQGVDLISSRQKYRYAAWVVVARGYERNSVCV